MTTEAPERTEAGMGWVEFTRLGRAQQSHRGDVSLSLGAGTKVRMSRSARILLGNPEGIDLLYDLSAGMIAVRPGTRFSQRRQNGKPVDSFSAAGLRDALRLPKEGIYRALLHLEDGMLVGEVKPAEKAT